MNKTLEEIAREYNDKGLLFRANINSISLGTKNECRLMLRQALKLVDSTIGEDNLVWLPQYDEIADWMSNTKGKGLLLRGGCGVGKSNILYFALPMIFYHSISKTIRPHRATDINRVDIQSLLNQWCYCIDDFGTEGIKSEYGSYYNVFSDLVDEAELKRKLLIISTNLHANEISERYGQRVTDRIIGLCRVVKFTQTSGNKETDIKSLRR